MATLLDIYVQRLPMSVGSALAAQAAQPLHWIIDTAPFFLGLFASLAGRRQDLLANLNAELARFNEQLEQRAAELARSNAELEQFAYVASHDLQEPLRMVTSYVQLLARRYRGQLSAEAEEFIGFVVAGVARMQALINDLLAFSRVGSRTRPLEPTPCGALVDQAIANLQVSIRESHAEVTRDELPTVRADPSQLGQIFQNLIANAIKFRSAQPPRIHISARRQQDGHVFSVTDNGIGVDPQYADRIFVIFQRLHPQSQYPGTGIGLAVCKKIVERHGGRIWVESQPGAGATFSFTIPDQPPARG
jgi:light-regulated signal transduction histidine kinase (bacteriophytochrome)